MFYFGTSEQTYEQAHDPASAKPGTTLPAHHLSDPKATLYHDPEVSIHATPLENLGFLSAQQPKTKRLRHSVHASPTPFVRFRAYEKWKRKAE
jgi:hypothetical protein